MSSETIYAKTQKGFEEMTRRTYRLPARMRALLIMIDGKLSAGELFARAQHPEDAQHLLETLLNDGFVEPIGGVSNALASDTSLRASAGSRITPPPDMAMAAAKRYITQALLDALGAEADNFTIHVEAAADITSLKAIALKYLDVIRSVSDRRKANAFRDGLVQLHLLGPAEGLLPTASRGSRPVDLDAAKRTMVQTLLDSLGPDADRFTMTVERATSANELDALLAKYQEVVRSIAGRKKAEEMVTTVRALLGM